jgi:hypothetical protein
MSNIFVIGDNLHLDGNVNNELLYPSNTRMSISNDNLVFIKSDDMSNTDGLIELDYNGMPVLPSVVLATKSGSKLGVIENVSGLVVKNNMNAPDEVSFTVNRYANGTECTLWKQIKDFKTVYLTHWNQWYEIQVTNTEDTDVVKSVTGTQAQQCELSQINLYEVEINTEGDIEVQAEKYGRDDNLATKFYDPDNPSLSLLNRILADKAPHYSIYHVDESLRNIQRTFSFDGTDILSALNEISEEVDCLFVFGESSEDDGEMHRTISAYDLEDYCTSCGERGMYDDVCTNCGSSDIVKGYGKDTGIFVTRENLGESISYESNKDEVKNCFRLTAGDDLMTAVVKSCNPNGSNYIWYLSDDMKEDMSAELRNKLTQYDADYEDYQKNFVMSEVPSDYISNYNALVDKYTGGAVELNKITDPITGYSNLLNSYYDAYDLYDYLNVSLMPGSSKKTVTTAQEQIDKLTVESMSPIGVTNIDTITITTMDAQVVNASKIYVDNGRYQVKVSASSKTGNKWSGLITVTSYADEEDTASKSLTIEFSGDDGEYIKQQIERAVSKMDAEDIGTVALFKKDIAEFTEALNDNYSLSYLQILQGACQSCLDVLIEQGCGQPTHRMYTEFYQPYLQKQQAIDAEIAERESELAILRRKSVVDEGGNVVRYDGEKGLIDYIESQMAKIRGFLDMRTYLGEDLWFELCKYRLEDEYSNDNFISDGLNNAEIVANAQKFLKQAWTEIIKSATLQHNISGNLYDFLIMSEFRNLTDNFDVGNWIRIEADDKVFKLRLLSYKIDYDNINNIDVEFSDMINGLGTMSDLQSIIASAKSIATSYSATVRQAEKGNTANSLITGMVANGLGLTNTKIVNDDDNQNVVFDSHGILMRKQNDFDDNYGDEQVKIINHGMYYTSDGWDTVSTGLGHFIYYDPADGQYKDGYGVIADTIVGNIILGNNVGIYNPDNSFVANENGVTITASPNSEDNLNLFTIQRDNGDGTATRYMYVDTDGTLKITGNSISITSGEDIVPLDRYIEKTVEDSVGDVSSTLNVTLSTDSCVANLRSDGSTDYSGCYTDVQVTKGDKDVTAQCTYEITPEDGVVGNWNESAHRYTITGLNKIARGSVLFAITYESVTLYKRFTVSIVYDGSEPIRTEIESSAGNIFVNNVVSTNLTCKVYRGNLDVTNLVVSFNWLKYNSDGTLDPNWSRVNAGNTITIDNSDIISRAVFKCEVTL